MSKSSEIKEKIIDRLNSLKVGNVLKTVIKEDYKVGVFDRDDISAYPAAIVCSPAVDSEPETNSGNFRTYTYEIIIIQKLDNLSNSENDIEDLSESIMDAFDKDYSLEGSADGGVTPMTSNPAPVCSRGKNFVAFQLTIKAKAYINLN